MSECEECFNDWWISYRENSDIARKEAWEIWKSAYMLGGSNPWYSITKEQWQVLNKSFQEE